MMARPRITIRPELSAQGIRKHPNPLLPLAVKTVVDIKKHLGKGLLVVDCGCGQLRNVQTLLSLSSRIVLVDTPYQLDRQHDFYGERMCIRDFVRKRWPRKRIEVMSSSDFEMASVDADIIFSVNVLDVTPQRTRRAILRSCHNNLGTDGLFVAIAPRNDIWTLRICTPDKKYQDGYAFTHPSGYTYYRNWTGTSLHAAIETAGFRIERDLSTHRQVCIICRDWAEAR